MGNVLLSGGFDDLRSRHVRLLHEASKIGALHVLLWSDERVKSIAGHDPKFPLAERVYFLESIRFVDQVSIVGPDESNDIPENCLKSGATWVVREEEHTPLHGEFCQEHGLELCVLPDQQLDGFPEFDPEPSSAPNDGRKKVVVTGCYDWFHSGHVRFFEEASEHGELHVVVGHDANIKLLKGEGHPMYSEQERRYMAASVRFVKRAYVSSGDGWLDAEPEIALIQPDIYVVNEDGDRPEKNEFCRARGIEYRVLKRTPKEGLPKRQSTDLRGF